MTRIATFNVNGVNGRLPVLLKWLGQSNYDIVCLQELKTSDEKFPADEIRRGRLRRDLAWPEILQWGGHSGSGNGAGGTTTWPAWRS